MATTPTFPWDFPARRLDGTPDPDRRWFLCEQGGRKMAATEASFSLAEIAEYTDAEGQTAYKPRAIYQLRERGEDGRFYPLTTCEGCDQHRRCRTYSARFTTYDDGPNGTRAIGSKTERVRYCDVCADLARGNWNGQTEGIVEVSVP